MGDFFVAIKDGGDHLVERGGIFFLVVEDSSKQPAPFRVLQFLLKNVELLKTFS